jgi:hypothetical protein
MADLTLGPSLGIPVVHLVDDAEEIVRETLAWLLHSRRPLSEGHASADAFEAWTSTQTAPGRPAARTGPRPRPAWCWTCACRGSQGAPDGR